MNEIELNIFTNRLLAIKQKDEDLYAVIAELIKAITTLSEITRKLNSPGEQIDAIKRTD